MKTRRVLSAMLILAMLLSTVMIGVTVRAEENLPFTDVPDTWYTEAVATVYNEGIMKGVSATTFEPLKSLTRAEFVTILGRLNKCEENLPYGFTDIPDGAWYKPYVGWAESAGIVNGYNGDPKAFAGDKNISRAEMMVMTARYMKSEWISFEDSADAKEFTDKDIVESLTWAADGINVTRKAGLIMGDAAGNFNPHANASRAEIATIIVRFISKLPEAKDEMFMKFDHLSELVECEGKNIVLTYGKWLPVKHNRPDAIGDQILPQMGLDTDTYEIFMAEEHYASFKKSYQDNVYNGNILHGECFKGNMASFGIRNKITGEETAKRMHLCNVYFDESPLDPYTYDVDIPEELHTAMLERGVHSTGNVARLASAFAKAEAGEDLNVCYIGGSITAGGGAQLNGNWISGVTDWIQHQFPKSKVTGINAGIGGTGSQLGILRLDKHVLNYDPDIVFVEFSANDQGGQAYRESFEALIRKCLEYDEDTAVVIVLVANSNKDKGLAAARKNHFEFAEYYDLPIVDIHMGVHVGIDAGEFTFDDFTHDGAHPTTWGHQVMSDIVEHFLSEVRGDIKTATADELKIKPLPEMLCADTYVGYKPIDDSNLENITGLGDWELIVDPDQAVLCVYNVWTSNKPGGEPFTFKFTGSELYVMMYNSACITVTATDGKNVYTGDTSTEWLFKDLPYNEYTVTLKMTGFDHDDETGLDEPPYIFGFVYR